MYLNHLYVRAFHRKTRGDKIRKKIQAAIAVLVVLAAIVTSLSGASITTQPTATANNQNTMNQGYSYTNTTNKTKSNGENASEYKNMTMNNMTIANTTNLRNNESRDMMNRTNMMCNNTCKPMMNQTQCFHFRNHTIIMTVLNQSQNECKPHLKIDSPKEGAMINTTNVTVMSNYTNFSVIPHFGMANVKGQGHLHYFKDVTAPTTQGQPATTANGTWNQSASDTYNWSNLTPGKHTFSVELVNNDHTPLNPPVVTMVNVTVKNATTNVSGITTNTTTNMTNMTTNMTNQSGKAVTVMLSAQNIKYNMSTISVPAGAQVTVKFDNKDNGIPHNFAVYQTSAATQMIFKGMIITGPASTTYTFTAPSKPGTYYFRCDVHPTVMNGDFIVT